MGKMYIANCTNQRQEFIYRVPEVSAPRHQAIEIGRQTQLSGDLSPKDIEFILRQHEKYGLVKVSEIDRRRPFTGMCWDEKPIHVSKVKTLWQHNQGVLTQMGKDNRQAAAVAANNAVEEQTPGALKSLELSVEEVATDKTPSPDFADGVRVTQDPAETNGRGFSKGKRGKEA